MGMDSYTSCPCFFLRSFFPVLRSLKAITHTSPFSGPIFPKLCSLEPLIYVLQRLKNLCSNKIEKHQIMPPQNIQYANVHSLRPKRGTTYVAPPNLLDPEILLGVFKNRLGSTVQTHEEEGGIPKPEHIPSQASC